MVAELLGCQVAGDSFGGLSTGGHQATQQLSNGATKLRNGALDPA
jgi:hypothetical protein